MFASATNGERPNNSKFSRCSIGNISNVLDAIEENNKRNCFTVSEGAFCGNKIVEAGEECDCGYDDVECTDRCCYPRLVSEYDKMKNSSAKGCQRRSNTQCRCAKLSSSHSFVSVDASSNDFYPTAPARDPAVLAKRATSFKNQKILCASNRRSAVSARCAVGHPLSVLRRWLSKTIPDATTILR